MGNHKKVIFKFTNSSKNRSSNLWCNCTVSTSYASRFMQVCAVNIF